MTIIIIIIVIITTGYDQITPPPFFPLQFFSNCITLFGANLCNCKNRYFEVLSE